MPGEYRDRNGNTQNPHWEDLLDTQNFSLSAVYGSEAFSLTANVFANRAENHFLFLDYANYQRRKDNNEVWDAGANISIVRQFKDLTKLIASSNFFYGDRNFPSSGFSSNIGNQIDFSTRQNIMMEMPRAFHDDLSSEFSLSWQFHKRDYSSPANVNSLHDQHNIMAVNRWGWHSSNIFTLRGGLDYRFITLDSTDIGSRSRHDGGFYLTGELQLTESFLIIPSVKIVVTGMIDNLQEKRSDENAINTAVIPKLGFLWNITEDLNIKNNYFRSFKFPDFEELFWNGSGGIGNPNLQPEDGWGADLGASWHITEIFQMEGVVFFQWIKDSIHWFSKNTGVWRPENVGEAVLFGMDNKICFNFPASIGPVKKIAPSISYQYILSYLLSYGYTFESNKRIPYNPEHTITGSLEFFWSGGSFSISGHFESLRYHDTANMTKLKPVSLLNAGYNQKLGKNLTVFSALRNILNTSYESFYDYPMPGITLTLGMRAALEATK
jgi:vitamin B12 transporter